MRNRAVLVDGGIYHIFTKSIAGFVIFRNNSDYSRMRSQLKYYKMDNPPMRFSHFLELKDKEGFTDRFLTDKESLVEIIAYCFMPTHIHLILKQLKRAGISNFMCNILNSYTRYFNNKNIRKGPLWEGRFKSVMVETDEQLLHLTRYLHLNPTTSLLVESPEGWEFSSYREFIGKIKEDTLCKNSEYLNISPEEYNDFVMSRREYQQELGKIKHMCFE